jgi:hypothetical protein
MIGVESLRWALTLAFVVATAFHLTRVVRPGGGDRVSEFLHLFMAGSMIPMIWPWGATVPPSVWITGFTLSTGWFVSRAILATGSRLPPAHFATATAAMLWMCAAMPAAGHHDMPGMRPAAAYPAWISAALGGYLVAAALWWTVRGMRLQPAVVAAWTPRWTEVCHATMSAGMGLVLLATV